MARALIRPGTRSATRIAIDRTRVLFLVLMASQFGTIVLYELDELPSSITLVTGLATALAGPLLSFLVSLHVFRHRRRSRGLDIGSIGLTYVVTCTSFAIIYLITADRYAQAFNQPGASATGRMDFGTALYFSIVTITTTGYGDIYPVSGLARTAVCCEIVTGLLYQVFVFSVAASLFTMPPATTD